LSVKARKLDSRSCSRKWAHAKLQAHLLAP
jgi:hypothetical protein